LKLVGHDHRIHTSPKQTPPKTTTRNLRVKAMISMD